MAVEKRILEDEEYFDNNQRGFFKKEESVEVELKDDAEEDLGTEVEQDIPFSANLADYMEEDDLTQIAKELCEDIDGDIQSRSEWIKTYKDGLQYLGFTVEERSEPFEGATGVFHPVLSEAVIRFQSNAIMEVFPASGPVNVRLVGNEEKEKVLQAKRVKEELNYQLTENMSEFRKETEQLLFRLPLSGSVFKKVYYDNEKNRPASLMVRGEDFVVDYETTDLETSERYTHIIKKTPNEIKKLQRSGFYSDVSLPKPTQKFKEAEERENKLMGTQASLDRDNRHTLYECHVYINLPGDFSDPDEIADPYIVTIDSQSQKVLSIYRNWEEEDDEKRIPSQYFVHFQYMPGLGFYGLGLIHLLGSIAKASTSILRQLIDAGTLSNLPGGLKTRGLRTVGDDTPIGPGEWRDVDVPGGSIRDNLFPLPYKEPSQVLAGLLGTVVEEGRRIGSIADTDVGNMSEAAPVGTTIALLERSLKVMSAVHARLHASMKTELKLISKVIHEFMGPEYSWDQEGKFDRNKDFDGRIDVIPVSDPNAATQSQKIVQLQAVMQLVQQSPELYNLKEAHRDGLNAIGIKDTERLLPLDEDPPRMDPVQENMAFLTGKPTKVWQDQNHAAHIQTHISAMNDPKMAEMVGQSPSAGRIRGQIEAHIAEHLAFQYRTEVEQAIGQELPPYGQPVDPEVENKIANMVAEGATRVKEMHENEIKQKKAEQILEDPVFQLKMKELGIKERAEITKQAQAQAKIELERDKLAQKEVSDEAKLQADVAKAGATIGANLITFGAQLEQSEREKAFELGERAEEAILNDLTKREEIRAKKDATKHNKGNKG